MKNLKRKIIISVLGISTTVFVLCLLHKRNVDIANFNAFKEKTSNDIMNYGSYSAMPCILDNQFKLANLETTMYMNDVLAAKSISDLKTIDNEVLSKIKKVKEEINTIESNKIDTYDVSQYLSNPSKYDLIVTFDKYTNVTSNIDDKNSNILDSVRAPDNVYNFSVDVPVSDNK